jgi:hypothetical protein
MARPIIQKGGMNMIEKDLEAPAETEEKKAAPPPHQLSNRVRVCGKWQKKGYRPTAAEQKAWLEQCKAQGRDSKTGRLIPKKVAAKK